MALAGLARSHPLRPWLCTGRSLGPSHTFLSFFFFSLSLSLGFFSFFLGFLLFFSTPGTPSFSGDFTVSAFLCFWTGSFSLSAKGLGEEEGGHQVSCDPPHPGLLAPQILRLQQVPRQLQFWEH